MKDGETRRQRQTRLRREHPVDLKIIVSDGQLIVDCNPIIPYNESRQRRLSFKVRQFNNQVLYKDPCAYCGECTKTMTADHIIPWSHGGSSNATNLTAACYDCNFRRGNTPFLQWLLECNMRKNIVMT